MSHLVYILHEIVFKAKKKIWQNVSSVSTAKSLTSLAQESLFT